MTRRLSLFLVDREHGSGPQFEENEAAAPGAVQAGRRRLVRAYANLAGEMTEAGYPDTPEAAAIKTEVTFYENLREQGEATAATPST